MTDAPRTIFVTGASGVLGQALLARLSGHRVIGLVHVNLPEATHGAQLVSGDIRQPHLGLSETDFHNLAAEVDAVIHAAAAGTNYSYGADVIEQTNRDGAKHAVEFALAAEAPLYHISTALLHNVGQTSDRRTAIGAGFDAYRTSKSVAEDVVRGSGIPHVIVRPSLIGGDSRTGEIASFQGIHMLFGYIMDGDVAFAPIAPDAYFDYVPQDLVADAVARLIECSVLDGVYWVTAGPDALSVAAVVDLIVEFGQAIGREVKRPRFVPPDIVDRLVRPVFMSEFSYRTRTRIERMLEFTHIAPPGNGPFPTSLPVLREALRVMDLPEMRGMTWRAFEYWAERKGLIERVST